MTTLKKTLHSPLSTSWTEQYVRLPVEGLASNAPYRLSINGKPTPFQYTGVNGEVLVRLGFEKDETKSLEFAPGESSETRLERVVIPITDSTRIGVPGRELLLADPFAAIGPFPVESRIHCDFAAESRTLTRTNDGPLFIEYELEYRFAQNHRYLITLRCYRHEAIVEVAEKFSLGMNARLEMTINPRGLFDSILSRDSFEGDDQPTVEALNIERPRDLLCRLQMPVLSEYFVPTNRGWFAFFDTKHEERGMLGFLGLYGAKWTNPVANMPKVSVCGGKTVMEASLTSGQRHWLLYVGPVEKTFTPQRRFVFHRLHAEFNGLRLDEHLDLTGQGVFDKGCWDKPGFFGPDYRPRAIRNVSLLTALKRTAEKGEHAGLNVLLDPAPAKQKDLLDKLFWRFERWVRQFQGFREGAHDYQKNVIGFSRTLRDRMIDYELLRKDRVMSDEQLAKVHSYFAFTARRILDEGRWPHSRTWLHPDHPESTRDIYTYPGEHRPDKLVWTNCLPNFQSDPMCALLHLGALLPEHPDAPAWRRFALDDINRQLDAYASANGAWEESINYALYTMNYFVATFRVFKGRCGIDYFKDRRVRSVAEWLVRFFGPYDKRFEAYTFPGIGNSRLPQIYCECLLTYAGELDEKDPLRGDLMAVYQKMDPVLSMTEFRPLLLAVATPPEHEHPIRPLASEHMDQLGVSMRHAHPSPTESYLFQKIGFYKDHYEGDETAINWYAKGTPLCMEYGTYTGDAGAFAAHNLVEIPDADGLRRGYMADSYFSPVVDYSRSEVPVTLKLSYGHMRNFAEVDGPPVKPKFFYLGEDNPVGPKTWKTRQLLFVKPDYVVLMDRVFGDVAHRFNLHVTADDVRREGSVVHAKGRFDLDLFCYVQHPAAFKFDSGELVPAPSVLGHGDANPHRQRFFRLYNETDGVYRTVSFAKERGRSVNIETVSPSGVKVVTPEYEDYVFTNDAFVTEAAADVRFEGRVGWIRREKSGRVIACVPDGEMIAAFGVTLRGRGPWTYNMEGVESGRVVVEK